MSVGRVPGRCECAGDGVYIGSSAIYSDGWNLIVHSAGGGALYVQNSAGTAEPVVASQFVAPAGNGVNIGGSYYYGDGTNSAVRQPGTFYVQNQAGSGAANLDAATISAESTLQVHGVASKGAGCSPNGSIAQDGTGAPLFCVNGAWASVSGGSGPYNNELYAINTGYGGCYTLPGYGTWAVVINSIQYWNPSGTSGAGPTIAQGVYGGGTQFCAPANGTNLTQLLGSAWRIS